MPPQDDHTALDASGAAGQTATPVPHDPTRVRTWRVRDLISWTSDYFAQRNIASPRLDAELLLAHTLATTRMGLYLALDRVVPPDGLAAYRDLVRRRAAREPVAYLVGEREFYGLPLWVTRDVLIPRPETERLVEIVVERLRHAVNVGSLRVLEVGTGCGAIAVALARELLERPVQVVATDISPAALDAARRNAERHGVAHAVDLRLGDLLQAVRSGETFHALVANLPYVRSADWAHLQPEIRDYEPRQALDGGRDGLDLIARLVRQAAEYVRPGCLLALEVGDGQAAEVARLIDAEQRFGPAESVEDYGGVERVVVAERTR